MCALPCLGVTAPSHIVANTPRMTVNCPTKRTVAASTVRSGSTVSGPSRAYGNQGTLAHLSEKAPYSEAKALRLILLPSGAGIIAS